MTAMDTLIFASIILFALLLLLAGLLFAVFNDSYIGKKRREIFLAIIILLLSLVAQNYAGYLLDADGGNPYARTGVGIYGYCVRPVIVLMFCYIVEPKKRHRNGWVLIGINTAVHLTALFSGICFSIDANNEFHRGPLGYTCHVISCNLLFYLLWLTIRRYRTDVRQRRNAFIPIFNAAVIIYSVLIDSTVDYREYPASFLTVAVVVCSVFYYIWLHLQFVREHEEDLAAQQRIQIMMTQIQPHFLYNTIATVKALCRQDPERAAEVADKFGQYLRQNMDSLTVQGRIPFAKELGYTKLYADIEMVRFDHIQVKYDIRDNDFLVPPLTLQPLVENAIRHGIRIRDDGVVYVTARRSGTFHEIVVADNGIGFDVRALETSDGPHIGIRNVRERIETMCGGSLHIDSRAGEGTVVTIRIPIRESAPGEEHPDNALPPRDTHRAADHLTGGA